MTIQESIYQYGSTPTMLPTSSFPKFPYGHMNQDACLNTNTKHLCDSQRLFIYLLLHNK